MSLAKVLVALRHMRTHPFLQVVGSNSEEVELVRSAADGDAKASEKLYLRCAPELTKWVSRVVLGSVDTEDIIQDTFVTAFIGLRKLKQPLAFRAWLKTIAMTKIRRRFRRQRLLLRLGFADVEAVDAESVVTSEAPPDVLVEVREVVTLLRRLPVEERLALSLQRIEGHGLEEIAEIMKLSLATVKRRLASAEQRFAALRKGRP